MVDKMQETMGGQPSGTRPTEGGVPVHAGGQRPPKRSMGSDADGGFSGQRRSGGKQRRRSSGQPGGRFRPAHDGGDPPRGSAASDRAAGASGGQRRRSGGKPGQGGDVPGKGRRSKRPTRAREFEQAIADQEMGVVEAVNGRGGDPAAASEQADRAAGEAARRDLRAESVKRQRKNRGRKSERPAYVEETFEDLQHENERLMKEIVLEIADIRTISLD